MENYKIVVLDDDPTGCQTVKDVPICFTFDEQSVYKMFCDPGRIFFIMTNSRSLSGAETEQLYRQLTLFSARAAEKTGKKFLIILRSDSTLRGHYPLENNVVRRTLEQECGIQVDGEILCPFFEEGGRFTIDNIHYVAMGGKLVPCAETEFAGDKTFGYHHSHLGEYVEEKTGGQYKADRLIYISNQELAENSDTVLEKLLSCQGNAVIANSQNYQELGALCSSIRKALGQKYFLFRTAASFVKALAEIENQELLTAKDIFQNDGIRKGLVIVGSHTKKTTEQLERLCSGMPELGTFEIDVNQLLKNPETYLPAAAEQIEAFLLRKTTVLYTTRTLVFDPDPEVSLKISARISELYAKLVKSISVKPDFVVAKGGITSADMFTKAMEAEQAVVQGQIAPGIPVLKSITENRYRDIPYIIFPGNVGSKETLFEVVSKCLK